MSETVVGCVCEVGAAVVVQAGGETGREREREGELRECPGCGQCN